MSLKRVALSGMIWTYSQQFGVQMINFIVSLFLTRILLPAEFGLIGMIAIFMGIGNTLLDGGLTSSLIRTQDANEEDYSTVFYFNFIGSIVIYLLIYLAAPWIADFYHQSLLVNIIRVYALTFILSSFGAVQNTVLTKNLQFKKQVLISLPAMLISGCFGIVLAYNNSGVWSLVAVALSNSFFTSLFLWCSSNWYPKLVFNKEKFKLHFNFGYKLTLSGLLDTVFTNLYNIVIGKFYLASQVGYYTRADSLMMLPVSNVSRSLSKVIYPVFSKLQDDIPRFRNAYKRIMQMVLFIIAPMMVIMGVLAEPLIVFLFTDKWLPVVPILQIICFSGLLYPIHSYNLMVLTVNGRSDLFLKLEIFKKGVTAIVLIASFFIGFYALFWGMLLSSILALFINTHYAGKMIQYNLISQLKDIMPIFSFSILMIITILGIDKLLISQSNFIRLTIGGLVGILVYGGVAILWKFDSIQDIKNLISKDDPSN